nr:GNAT family N-acetyltransferase [Microbacterium immunditiarum]
MRREDRHAYVATLADLEVATVQYERSDERLVLLTTTVIPAYRGRGISDELIAYALDDIRRRSERITVLCPVVKAFLERYPENLDLVDASRPDY